MLLDRMSQCVQFQSNFYGGLNNCLPQLHSSFKSSCRTQDHHVTPKMSHARTRFIKTFSDDERGRSTWERDGASLGYDNDARIIIKINITLVVLGYHYIDENVLQVNER